MKTYSHTIRSFIKYLNNKDEQGGFWLPNIQRPFVWKEEQVEKLYDSILREYPIGTLLIWKTKSLIKRRKFIDNYQSGTSLSTYYIPQDSTQKMMVLDGQQRLQALYIGLVGSYSNKELFIDISSGDQAAPNDKKYIFTFLDPSKAQFPFVKIKDIVLSHERPGKLQSTLITKANGSLSEKQKERIYNNIELIREVFCIQENITYQLVDSIDRPDTYSEDDIVEIFIRANSGGTKLAKSDLLFSLLTVSWENAENEMDELLSDINTTGYKFDRDFILKVCLVLLNKGAKYEVAKFRDNETKTNIETNWDKISRSIRGIKDFVYSNTYLRTDKTLPSYVSLIPLIYAHYHYPSSFLDHDDYVEYLVRVNLTGVFGGASDGFTDTLIKSIQDNKRFDLSKIYEVIRNKGKSMEVLDKTLLGLQYKSKEVHLLFNLWYGFNYQPSLKDNQPQIDHIFPQSKLKEIKVFNPSTNRSQMKYKTKSRDQIGNLMLLTQKENGAAGKTDIIPEIWFQDKSDEYLEKHLIPKDPELWKLDRFEDFIEERKKLILKHFAYLIYKTN